MHAEGSSPPPETASTPTPQPTTVAAAHSRKRKRPTAPATASSPGPSDQTTDLLATSRADLSSRPILTISRGPVFVPIAEGSEWFKTEMVGVNRVGYRYVPAGINPPGFASPCRTIESNPTSFRVSWEDRSPFLKVSKDGLGLAASTGFRSARCNAPIREGKWYMEVRIVHGGGEHVSEDSRREGSHVRLGFGRREAHLNAPVGLDGYSYGYRDKTGDKVTLSRPRPYGRPFGSGDVVGMYISLPPRRQANPKDPHDPAHLKRERIPIDLKGQEVFEILEYPPSKEMQTLMDYSGKPTNSGSLPSSSKQKAAAGRLPERGAPAQPGAAKPPTANLRPLPTLPGSRIAFFVNGQCQGPAFTDLYDYLPLRQTDTQRKANSRKRTREGVKEHRENPFDDGTLGYYPFISLFNDAVVRLNPGPDFEFPPPDDIDALLDGKTEPSAQPTAPTEPPPDISMLDASIDNDIKPSIPPIPTHPTRTWRPTLSRYPEFMSEEWAFDALEESAAKLELAHLAQKEAEEDEKRKQREKKRAAAEAKKRARKEAMADKVARDVKDEEEKELESEREREREREKSTSAMDKIQKERYTPSPLGLHGPGMPGIGHLPSSSHAHTHTHNHTQPSPSPLRHSTSAYEQREEDGASHSHEHEHEHDGLHYRDEDHDHDHDLDPASEPHSPAPTAASYGDLQGGQSGYSSENNQDILPEDVEDDNDMDVDHELEAMLS